MKKGLFKWCPIGLPMVILVFFSLTGNSQVNEITVRGKVHSDSAVLAGATVFLKTNPQRATKADDKGTFSIKVPANGILVFSSVGYETQEVEIQGNSILNILLKPQDNKLGEVVVVGYGTQKKTTDRKSVV